LGLLARPRANDECGVTVYPLSFGVFERPGDRDKSIDFVQTSIQYRKHVWRDVSVRIALESPLVWRSNGTWFHGAPPIAFSVGAGLGEFKNGATLP